MRLSPLEVGLVRLQALLLLLSPEHVMFLEAGLLIFKDPPFAFECVKLLVALGFFGPASLEVCRKLFAQAFKAFAMLDRA